MSETNTTLNVLVVEDDFVNIFIMKHFLDNQYNTSYAKSAQEVREVIRTQNFEVVLMDINLAEDSPNGLEIMKELKKDARFSKTKFFAITSYHQSEEREFFLAEGFDNFFTKPVLREDILEAINAAAVESGIRQGTLERKSED